MAWEHDLEENLVQGGLRGTFLKFKDLQFKGCDDHIMALVYSAFNGVLLDWAKERYPSFSHGKKRGGFVSLPFHLLKHISKCLRKVYSGFNTVFLSLLLLAAGVGFPAACFRR